MNSKQKLLIEQLDRKILPLKVLNKTVIPPKGWIYTIRIALGMSLRQLSGRLDKAPQSIKDMEEREENGSIMLKTLKEVANGLDMKLVYGFIPKEDSIEQMIEKRAYEIATEIVLRTSNTMKLEDQENSKERIDEAIKNRAEEISYLMPKYLWD